MKLLLGSLLSAGAAAISIRGATLDLAQIRAEGATTKSVKNLEDTLLNLLNDGSANTPALRQFIDQIKAMINNEMKPQVLLHRDEEQKRLNGTLSAFATCSRGLKRDTDSTAIAISGVEDLRAQLAKATSELSVLVSSEQSCLKTLAAYTELETSWCTSLDTMTKNTNPCGCTVSSSTYESSLSGISTCFATHLAKFRTTSSNCTDAKNKVAAEKPKCTARTTAVAQQRTVVSTLQAQVDSASCAAFTRGKQACDSSDSCYSKALKELRDIVRTARSQEEGMRSEWEGLGRMECLSNVFQVEDEDRAKAIKDCKERDVDTSRLRLRYPVAPVADSCRTPTGVQCKPQENIVFLNPDFEQGYSTTDAHYVGDGYIYKKIQGWTSAGSTVYITSGNGPWSGTQGVSGSYFLGLQQTSAQVTQAVSGHIPGKTYTLTFWAATRNAPYPVSTLQLTIDGEVRFTQEFAYGPFTKYSVSYTARSSSPVIAFTNISPNGDRTVFLDNLSIA